MDMLRLLYLDQPFEISLETYAKCNAACTFCPYPTLDRIGERMPDELIDRLVQEMAKFQRPFNFSPFKVNEPLLDKRVLPLCERMNQDVPKAEIRIFSNGSTLTPVNVERIGRLINLNHLWVSLNSCEKDEYELLMRLPFDRTIANLDALHKTVEDGGFHHEVVVSTVGGPNDKFKNYVHHRWPLFKCVLIKRDAWIDFTNSQDLIVPQMPCARWFELNIMADGKVALCCMDSRGDYSIGDVNSMTLLEVYNAPLYRRRRESMLNRQEVKPCSTCTY
jgi:sulfatase maturation enzyme AslB (radical SAM superfamily)